MTDDLDVFETGDGGVEDVPDAPDDQGPLGEGAHVVRAGECIESIAFEYGFHWETIWTDSANRQLKDARQDPSVLLEGDWLTIPERRAKEESKPTEVRHRFRRLGLPSKFAIRFLDEKGEPRAGAPFSLEIEGAFEEGALDPSGALEVSVHPAARSGKISVGEGEEKEQYQLELGHLDPASETCGTQIRLANLGYACGAPDGEYGPRTQAAVSAFQSRHGMEVTGQLDEETRARIRKAHDES